MIGTPRAWKEEVLPGSKPVFSSRTVTSTVARAPGHPDTRTSGGSDVVGGYDGADLFEVVVGEHEADVATGVGEEMLRLRKLREDEAKSTANHSILSHRHNALAVEGNTDLMHLVKDSIVNVDDGVHCTEYK